MGTRTTRNGASERADALGSQVSPESSRRFLSMLQKSVRATETGGDEEAPFAPGQFFPEDTSILTQIVEEVEDEIDPEVEPAQELEIEESEPTQEPEPEPEIEVETDEPKPTPVIDLSVARAQREPEPQEDEEDLEDQDEDTDAEVDGDLLEELRVFAEQTAEQSLAAGVHDLDLRRALTALPEDAALIAIIQRGNLKAGKRAIVDRRITIAGLAKDVDTRLASQQVPSRGLSPIAGVIHQLKLRLDEVLTASAQRLPADLHASNIEAGAQVRIHTDAAEVFEKARGQLLPLVRKVTAAVAELGMVYQDRRDLGPAKQVVDGFVSAAGSLKADLIRSHATCGEAEERLREIMDESQSLRTRARSLVNLLRQIVGSAELLGAKVPATIEAQIKKTTDPIEHLLSEATASVYELITPEWDSKIDRALSSIDRDKHRAKHMVDPIRPSVFKRRMDRVEELRRLTLIAFHVLTHGKLTRGSKDPHRGFGKETITHNTLPLSDLIDRTESDMCQQMLLRFNRHRDIELQVREALNAQGHTRIRKEVLEAAMDTECGPELVDINRVGRGWCYRPNEQGRKQALAWLDECIDPAGVRAKIQNGHRAYYAKKFADRGKKTT